MKLPEIKRCPHCGNIASMKVETYRATAYTPKFSEYRIECDKAECSATTMMKHTPREAIEVWNRRNGTMQSE